MSWAEDNGHDMPWTPGDEETSNEGEVAFSKIAFSTGQAWLIEFDDGKKCWFPKSLCTIETDERPGGMLYAPTWLLDKNEVNY